MAPTKLKARRARAVAREALLNVASALTGRTCPADTFIIATSGRCEYRNKGIDVFLDAVKTIENSRPSRPTVAFVLVPAWMKEPREDLRSALEKKSLKSGETNAALPEPVITHELNNPNDDAILNRIRQLGIGRDPASGVQVIYVPCYLNGKDGIFNKDYYEILCGIDATAFPSYYEPWGYTPLESVAFGIPTVTTSLSGFGQWILSSSKNGFDASGVEVLTRNDSNYGEVVNNLAHKLMQLADDTDEERERISKAARETAERAEWNYFITYYVKAFKIAADAAEQRDSH